MALCKAQKPRNIVERMHKITKVRGFLKTRHLRLITTDSGALDLLSVKHVFTLKPTNVVSYAILNNVFLFKNTEVINILFTKIKWVKREIVSLYG